MAAIVSERFNEVEYNLASHESKGNDRQSEMLQSLRSFIIKQAILSSETQQLHSEKGKSTKNRGDSFIQSVVRRFRSRSSSGSASDSSTTPSSPKQQSSNRFSLFRRSSSQKKNEDSTRGVEEINWAEKTSLVLDLISNSPYCVTDILVADEEQFDTTLKRAVATYLAKDLFQDVEDDIRQQRALAVLLDELVHQDFRACEDNGSGPQSALRDNSSGAVLFLLALVRREDNITLVDDFLGRMLNQNKNTAADAQGLASRLLKGLEENFQISTTLSMINDQIYTCAPEGGREKLVAGFFLLRVINPALVSFTTPNYSQRFLIDTARIVQHMASGTIPQAMSNPTLPDEFLSDAHKRMTKVIQNMCLRNRQ